MTENKGSFARCVSITCHVNAVCARMLYHAETAILLLRIQVHPARDPGPSDIGYFLPSNFPRAGQEKKIQFSTDMSWTNNYDPSS